MDVKQNKPDAAAAEMSDFRRRAPVIFSVAAALGMLGLAYASVPLYRIFCQVTGYGGTTRASASAPGPVVERRMTVQFDANTARNLGWEFKPAQRQIKLKIGEEGLAFYRARNTTNKTLTGTAVFNVSPFSAGPYFNKIACFCFTEQTLEPGEEKDMPVTFFIDPDIVKDSNLDSIEVVTLSYTFFPVKEPAAQKNQQAALGGTASGKRTR